ncbi:TPA: DUF3173 family protein [Streptococcus suis]|uniref:DUF3173 family protein n=1 Tax=Streptococcus suis TaxID=1307 RepID=UPI000402CF89|nr:DUF3173 family protein [Streptococcus suis]NQH20915.1 DUF3173 family protein [Streptococcus suis]CYU99922.1 Domain of uncharacterised function (DUF3173) [Streptococcus suis]HEM2798996.1 DUF3173 family protein [Streptococcus suis]HEM3209004.1 DUF3173 family protein [Streptococcus suis 22083]HEM3936631.1 DUF3173 family protein [Streptococcus suis]
MSKTVNHKILVELGFPKHTARNIIHQAKSIAVEKFKESSNSLSNMIELKKSPFDNSRLDLAPTYIVEELLGFELPFDKERNLRNGN